MWVRPRILILAVSVWALAACVTTQPRTQVKATTVYSDDGVSELTAPEAWRTRPGLGQSATIRLADDASANYLLLNSYHPEEKDGSALAQFAERLSTSLSKRLKGGRISAPRTFTVNGRPAVQYTISEGGGDFPLVYLSTFIEGAHARHHLIAWTLAERYGANRVAMLEVTDSFRESAQRRSAKQRTDLKFNWPDRMTSTVTLRSKSNKRGEVTQFSVRAVTTVRPLGEDHLLISGKVTDKKFSPALKDKGKGNYLERVLKEATIDVPDYVVDCAGDFVRIENLAPYQKRIEDALVNGLPEGPTEARAKAQQLVRSLVTEETLSAAVQDEWNTTVGNWADGSYVPGERYELQQTYQSPALGDQTFPMQVTQQLAGRQACRTGAAANSCVRLVQTSRVSDPAFVKAMSAFVRKAVAAEVSVDKAEVLKTVEVIADPKTLLPYRTVVKETKTFVVSAKGEASKTSEETEESVTKYSY
jgi:hypothetical protein